MVADIIQSRDLSSAELNHNPASHSLFQDAYSLVNAHPVVAEVGTAAAIAVLGRFGGTLGRAIGFLEHSSPEMLAEAKALESETRTTFLETQYLQKPYLVPDHIRQTLVATADELGQKFPEFTSITSVGGTTNGSLALRMIEGKKTASDLDFYLVGHAVLPDRLGQMSKVVTTRARAIGLGSDACLNGARSCNYLNLDAIGQHIEAGDVNLLSLPFQSSFGKTEEARTAVLQGILERPDKQQVWDAVRDWHLQSLSMHHGSWSLDFGNRILREYYPKKIELFSLPKTPEEALAVVGSE
ncbi:MAG TPA: hypothetical protein V6C97_10645 [Oculatellaceae cyanobacterium]